MDTNIKINTPVLVIIFNRPDKVRVLFEALAKIQPRRIYVSADGPREGVAGEKEKCEESRKIAQAVTWPCEVITNFSDKNLGCKIAVSKAITWFFTKVDAGIILEDDCIPSPSFFPFCTELLDKYRDNPQVMHINGTTFLKADDSLKPTESYHFSHITHVWGWATWKRAWDNYDIDMKHLDLMDTNFPYAKYWINLFKHVRAKKVDTWDAQWVYSIMFRKGVNITPAVNLIENIGFDKQATHTHKKNKSAQKAYTIASPFKHTRTISVDQKADDMVMKKVYLSNIWRKLISKFW